METKLLETLTTGDFLLMSRLSLTFYLSNEMKALGTSLDLMKVKESTSTLLISFALSSRLWTPSYTFHIPLLRCVPLMCSQPTSTALAPHTAQHQALIPRWYVPTISYPVSSTVNFIKSRSFAVHSIFLPDGAHVGGALWGVRRRHPLLVKQAEHSGQDGEEGQLQRDGTSPFRQNAHVVQPCSPALRDCVQISINYSIMLNLCVMCVTESKSS